MSPADPKWLPTGMREPRQAAHEHDWARCGGTLDTPSNCCTACDALTSTIAARDDAWRAAPEQARAAAVEEYRERVVAWLLWAGRDEEAAILAADEWYVGPKALARARALIKEVRRG